jgi:hypothetical protein
MATGNLAAPTNTFAWSMSQDIGRQKGSDSNGRTENKFD